MRKCFICSWFVWVLKTDDNCFYSAKKPCAPDLQVNCSHVCYTDNNKTAKCACFANYELQSDRKTCLGAFINCWFMRSLQIRKFASRTTPPTWIVPCDKKRNSTPHAAQHHIFLIGLELQAIFNDWFQFRAPDFLPTSHKRDFCHLFAPIVSHRMTQSAFETENIFSMAITTCSDVAVVGTSDVLPL